MASRRYWGNKMTRFSSSLSIRIPERPQPRKESMTEERAATRIESPTEEGESMESKFAELAESENGRVLEEATEL